MREKLYIASISEDAALLADEFKVGFEIDHYCMAENMDVHKFSETDRQVKKEIAQSGSERMTFHAPFNELHPAAIDYRIKEIAFERYERAYQLAREHYGIHKMIVHSGYMPHVYYKVWHHERSIEFWNKYMDDKPEDFEICIENVLEDEPYMMAKLAEELDRPNVKLCLDIGHANCISDVPVEEWIRVMGPYTAHLHIHNNYGEHDYHNALQDGSIDMAAALENIDKYCRKDATITIESLDGRKSLEWLDEGGYLK